MVTSTPDPSGLVVPTRWEALPIIKALGFVRTSGDSYRYEKNGRTLLMRISGIGQAAASRASFALCDEGVKELVSVGYCGALVSDLKVGDLVTDRIATSPVPVWDRSSREALAARASARAVDMETRAVVEAGTRRGVPIRILRVVSDQLGDDVSPLLGTKPTFSPLRIALRLLNPAHWPHALKMHRQSQKANVRLIEAVRAHLL